MKKALLGASALIGATSLASGPALAAQAPEIQFSGALAFEGVWNDGDQEAAGSGFNITGNEQQSELVWEAQGVADNGLEYGANVQWRWQRADNGFDEAWIDFSGSFGRVYLGGEDGVTDLVAGTAGHSVQVGTWGTDGNNALRNVNFLGIDTGVHYYQSHEGISQATDNNKVGYVTPSFAGFTAGVSYTPDGNFQQQTGVNDGGAQKITELAAGYSNAFGDVSFTVDGAYAIGEDESNNAGVTAEVENEDIATYQLGALVSFAGVSVAGSYLQEDDSGCPVDVANCESGEAWNVGAGYSFGATGLSVMWQEGESDPDGDGQLDESEIFHAGVSHQLAEGLSAYANYYNFSLQADGGLTQATTNDADILILGSRVTF